MEYLRRYISGSPSGPSATKSKALDIVDPKISFKLFLGPMQPDGIYGVSDNDE